MSKNICPINKNFYFINKCEVSCCIYYSNKAKKNCIFLTKKEKTKRAIGENLNLCDSDITKYKSYNFKNKKIFLREKKLIVNRIKKYIILYEFLIWLDEESKNLKSEDKALKIRSDLPVIIKTYILKNTQYINSKNWRLFLKYKNMKNVSFNFFSFFKNYVNKA